MYKCIKMIIMVTENDDLLDVVTKILHYKGHTSFHTLSHIFVVFLLMFHRNKNLIETSK